MGTYESNLSFATQKKVIKFSFLAPRAQRIPLLESLFYLKRFAKKELWRKRMKEVTGANLIYIGQTGLDGDRNTDYFVIDPFYYSERQRDDLARWMYESNSKELVLAEECTEADYKEMVGKITELRVVDLSDRFSFILHAFKEGGMWCLESHDITNPQLAQLLDDLGDKEGLEFLVAKP